MLGYTTKFKMHFFPIVILAAFMVTAVQLQCDPMTQYQKDDLCCKMCGPGTSMAVLSTCEKPQCNECQENEYQDKYTKEDKCNRQIYCDPNKNFEDPVQRSKKVKSTCKCKVGFHCSDECETCLPHTICKPGTGARSTGNHSHDTVCQECPKGTFSDISSWKSVCKNWTECEVGYHIERRGTAVSDNICAKTSRTHIIVISVSVIVLVIALVALVYWRCRGNVKYKVKHFLVDDSHRGGRQNEQPICITVQPQSVDTVPMITEQSTQEEGGTPEGHGMTPEENMDEDSQETCKLTENGNFVTQERGKSDILSRQESQTCTFTDSL